MDTTTHEFAIIETWKDSQIETGTAEEIVNVLFETENARVVRVFPESGQFSFNLIKSGVHIIKSDGIELRRETTVRIEQINSFGRVFDIATVRRSDIEIHQTTLNFESLVVVSSLAEAIMVKFSSVW